MLCCSTGGMQYIINNGGIDTEEDYPYVALDAKCAQKKEGRCAFSQHKPAAQPADWPCSIPLVSKISRRLQQNGPDQSALPAFDHACAFD